MLDLRTLIVGAGECRTPRPLDILGEPTLIKLAGADTGDRFSVIETESLPMRGPPLHRHTREDEWFFVLEGEVTFQVDGVRTQAGPGVSAFLPRGTAHTYQNFSSRHARLLVMVTPAGFDRFFMDLDALTRGQAQPDFAKVERLMNDYGLELVGPPLTA
jgi:quercetin dioxygenase-like cupin family protein